MRSIKVLICCFCCFKLGSSSSSFFSTLGLNVVFYGGLRLMFWKPIGLATICYWNSKKEINGNIILKFHIKITCKHNKARYLEIFKFFLSSFWQRQQWSVIVLTKNSINAHKVYVSPKDRVVKEKKWRCAKHAVELFKPILRTEWSAECHYSGFLFTSLYNK